MHYLFTHASATRVLGVWPEPQIFFTEFAPHAHYFDALCLIGFHQKVVFHRTTSAILIGDTVPLLPGFAILDAEP